MIYYVNSLNTNPELTIYLYVYFLSIKFNLFVKNLSLESSFDFITKFIEKTQCALVDCLFNSWIAIVPI